jgi:uncharacterized protein (DUF885 family)
VTAVSPLPEGTGPIAHLSDRFVTRAAALDPIAATFEGIHGHDGELTDYSPAGIEERLQHAHATLRELATESAADDAERIAAEALRRYLELGIELTETDEDLRPLRVIGSPVSEIRLCFDLMARDTADDWDTIAARVAGVPHALDGVRDALDTGVRAGVVAARRQAVACAQQADTWGGVKREGTPFFLGLVDEYDAAAFGDRSVRPALERAAHRATDAYASFGRYLVEEYLTHADERDAAGEERYQRLARSFTGTRLDLHETYAWGWDELHRIEDAMHDVAERILPGQPLGAVIDHLETDPARMLEGEDALKTWLQSLIDRTIDEMHGTHFDIPEPLRRCEAMIAPPGGAAAMYYTGPSEDFTRPGRTWYPTQGRTRFPLWGEVSICYHEAVPGHHLQVGTMRFRRDRLNRFQRTMGWNAGHGEGWALYAERLMGELGYFEDPAFELGMLRAQAMRAVRVVVDIGLHLELPIPEDEEFSPGATWTPDVALDFVINRSRFPADFMTSEVDRYLGWPGQAICYKVGERVWLRAREDARRRHGDDFDLKAFHTRALELGSMGLDQLEEELARI